MYIKWHREIISLHTPPVRLFAQESHSYSTGQLWIQSEIKLEAAGKPPLRELFAPPIRHL